MWHGDCGLRGLLWGGWRGVAVGCVMAAASLAAGAAQPAAAQPPAPQHTPAQVQARVRELARDGGATRAKADELRKTYPAPLLIEALVGAITCEPGFAGAAPARFAAYELLGRLGDVGGAGGAGILVISNDKQVDQLVLGLKEKDPQIRGACAAALGRVVEARRAGVAEPLADVLDDESPAVSQRALLSLAGFKLRREAPAQVRTVAFAPTEVMRERWRAFDRDAAARNAALPPQEQAVREAAMSVIASWEGVAVLVDRDLSKDESGRAARAVSIGRRIVQERGRLDLDETRQRLVIAELTELLRQPGEARDADRGAAMALGMLAQHGRSDEVKQGAKRALDDALEAAPESKKGLIRDAQAQAR